MERTTVTRQRLEELVEESDGEKRTTYLFYLTQMYWEEGRYEKALEAALIVSQGYDGAAILGYGDAVGLLKRMGRMEEHFTVLKEYMERYWDNSMMGTHDDIFDLAECYRYGCGTSIDRVEAKRWYERYLIKEERKSPEEPSKKPEWKVRAAKEFTVKPYDENGEVTRDIYIIPDN